MEYTPFGSKSGVSHLGTNLVRPIWKPILGALICEQMWGAAFGIQSVVLNLKAYQK